MKLEISGEIIKSLFFMCKNTVQVKVKLLMFGDKDLGTCIFEKPPQILEYKKHR